MANRPESPSRAVALDSNLLLLYAVGRTSIGYIKDCRRLQAYSIPDYFLLVELLSTPPLIVLTPNTISETSNLFGRKDARKAAQVSETMKALLDRFSEEYVPSLNALARPEARALGVTDAVLLILASRQIRLVTADLDLWIAARRAGYDAVNFNHVRDARFPG